MPRVGDDGAFPAWLWDGAFQGSDDGAFPAGTGEPEQPYYRYGAVPLDTHYTPAVYFTLRGRRGRVVDQEGDAWDDEPQFEFCLWKCRMADLVQLASGDGSQGIRFKARALNDSAGEFGGTPTDPYGWFRQQPGPGGRVRPVEPTYCDDGAFPAVGFGTSGNDGAFPVH